MKGLTLESWLQGSFKWMLNQFSEIKLISVNFLFFRDDWLIIVGKLNCKKNVQ